MAKCSGTGGFGSLMAVRWRYRWIRGRAGEFAAPEQSERARDLTSHWDANWADADPDAVVWGQRARHVRFHSLPGSKQYADTDAERAEILRRHLVVLSELLGSERHLGPRVHRGRLRPAGLGVRLDSHHAPCKLALARNPPTSGAKRTLYLWAACRLTRAELEDVLAAIADDDGRAGSVAFTNSEVEWLYCPYDGGADVVLPTSADRDHLRARHYDWLSDHPEGL